MCTDISKELKPLLINLDFKVVIFLPFYKCGSQEAPGTITLDREGIERYKFALLATFPQNELTDAEKIELQEYTGKEKDSKRKVPLPAVSLGQMVGIIKANPILIKQLVSRITTNVANRERYVKRKLYEVAAIVSIVLKEYQAEERILDLCTGTGDLVNIIVSLNYPVSGVDISDHLLRNGVIYNVLMNRRIGQRRQADLAHADVLTSELPASEVWTAKHACASYDALPDRIIQRFATDPHARRLYLLTCCAAKSMGYCPDAYIELGYISRQKWDEACSATSDPGTGADEGKVRRVQDAFRTINEVRLRYTREVLHLNAELIEVPGTIMNQMIVLKKMI